MSIAYARSIQAKTGTMQARDLQAGDVILIRRAGFGARKPEAITKVSRRGGNVLLTFSWGQHLTSPKMNVALA